MQIFLWARYHKDRLLVSRTFREDSISYVYKTYFIMSLWKSKSRLDWTFIPFSGPRFDFSLKHDLVSIGLS